ncbi:MULTISPECIES: GNAT family N-acetyltransferase [unclassified Schaalia]|uniref:GNAT family N-acetyltransferase n=1 Tax=unclassified Schaalia TaxID=2691889 RepID=UPI001E3A75DB|nr:MULTISPECIES: GNAT family N-acetyltransferase [unclassified Schaalia]MCD4549417.1 GNAT family N-acetyltransferase [Schaalia sp. lx-260]MCD4557978.1 GNAT family N-acetyltransferase [Schaalia sp. lx-100]
MTQRTMKAQLQALADVERPENYEIATLTRQDIPALAVLNIVAYEAPYTAQALFEATDELRLIFDGVFGIPRDDSFVGAWHEGTLIAAILVVVGPPWDEADTNTPVVLDLMVDPEFRRRGIATALIAEIARRCMKWGKESLSLRLDAHHSAAASLYDLLGFEESTK